ncbi:hemoglobin subunit beta-like [Brachyhypopomus gauderio]|uniref:hemoglobin subunit beta-like n=1 Tax=Brachyhypopomus gauderio TaxID=698409 RepID=UPI004042837D
MVEFTDAERSAIVSVWGQLHADEVGAHAIARLLIVYPWTQRYFSAFGNISSPAAIMGNPKVAAHGKVVMGALEKGVKNLNNLKGTYAALSTMHSEKLHVDPDNFRLLAHCISTTIAMKLGHSAFTPEVQEAIEKFLSAVASALGKQYH